MSSPAKIFEAYTKATLPPGDPPRDEVFVMGDINSSLIKTARGRTILLQHDVSTPRPYSRINHVQGTTWAFRGYPDRLSLVSDKDGGEWIEELDPVRQHQVRKRVVKGKTRSLRVILGSPRNQ